MAVPGFNLVTMANNLVRYRCPLYTKEFPIILLYSEKSGCTAAIKWFFWQTGLLDDALTISHWVHNYENSVFKKTPNYRSDLVQHLCSNDKRIIKFVRDPFERAVSSYLILLGAAARKPNHFSHRHWENICRHIYGRPDDPRGLSFRDFLMYLCETSTVVGEADGHFAQQFRIEEQFFPVETHRLGNMFKVLKSLESEMHLPTSDAAVLESRHHRVYDKSFSTVVADVRFEKGAFADQRPPQFRAFYSAETENLVQELFYDDFRNYDFPDKL